MTDKRLRGIRGATTVTEDSRDAIVEATSTLLTQMLEKNGLEEEDLVTILFTSTPDLTSEFPAAAARNIGITGVPLICASEIDVQGAVPKCIRVLIQAYSNLEAGSVKHIYLGEARRLRADLFE